MDGQATTTGKTAISENRWAQAQAAEQNYWDRLDGGELLRICTEKPVFLRQIPRDLLTTIFDCRDVLEIGCGPLGISLASFYDKKCTLKSLKKIDPLQQKSVTDSVEPSDWSQSIISWAEMLSEEGEYIQRSGESIRQSQPSYDTVITYNVLDHVQDPELILSNAWSALRPGGHILVGVDCLSLFGRLKFELFHRHLRPNSISVKAHPHTFLPRDVSGMMARVGFTKLNLFGAPRFVEALAGSCIRPAFVATKPKQ